MVASVRRPPCSSTTISTIQTAAGRQPTTVAAATITAGNSSSSSSAAATTRITGVRTRALVAAVHCRAAAVPAAGSVRLKPALEVGMMRCQKSFPSRTPYSAMRTSIIPAATAIIIIITITVVETTATTLGGEQQVGGVPTEGVDLDILPPLSVGMNHRQFTQPFAGIWPPPQGGDNSNEPPRPHHRPCSAAAISGRPSTRTSPGCCWPTTTRPVCPPATAIIPLLPQATTTTSWPCHRRQIWTTTCPS